MTQTAKWPTDEAEKLAINIERRGSMEGHHIWPEMLQRALDEAYNRGYYAARDDAKRLQDMGVKLS